MCGFYFMKKGSKNTPCRCPASRGQTEVSRVERRSFIGAEINEFVVVYNGLVLFLSPSDNGCPLEELQAFC